METWFYRKKRTFCGELSFEIMGTSMSTSFQTENRIEFVARIVTIDLLIYLFYFIYLFIFIYLFQVHFLASLRGLAHIALKHSLDGVQRPRLAGNKSQPWKRVKLTRAEVSFLHAKVFLCNRQTLILSSRILSRSFSSLFFLAALFVNPHLCSRSGGHLDFC